MKYKKTTLPNGLRIITVPMKGNPAATVMVMVETGSNYEKASENGLSHFLEHMVFKGTENRPTSRLIFNELDGLGAQSNAFTANEFTGYYAKAEKNHWKHLLELLSDIYLHPIFPETEIEKERGVILQEISMYEDQPQAQVWEVISELVYGDAPAGKPISGSRENVKKFSRENFVTYRNTHYVAKKTLIVVAGDISEVELKKEVQKLFKEIPDKKKVGKEKVLVKQGAPRLKVHKKDTDQMHLVFGMRSFGSKDKRSPALTLLAAILGGGFSSRLYEKLREEMGVAYFVRAGNDRYTDHGLFNVYAGIDAERLEEVVRVVLAECKRLREESVSEEDLKRTKDYVAGNMYLGLETTDSLAEFYTIQEIVKGEILSPAEWEASIRRVTAKEIQKAARDVFQDDRLNLAIVGKV